MTNASTPVRCYPFKRPVLTSSAANDANHCGPQLVACPRTANGISLCSNGNCSISCKSGYSKIADRCVDTSNNVNFCGIETPIVCPRQVNADASCVEGVCKLTCKSGFHFESVTIKDANGAHQIVQRCLNLQSDPRNCNKVNNRCPTSPNGIASCTLGQCSIGCNNDFTYHEGQCLPSEIHALSLPVEKLILDQVSRIVQRLATFARHQLPAMVFRSVIVCKTSVIAFICLLTSALRTQLYNRLRR